MLNFVSFFSIMFQIYIRKWIIVRSIGSDLWQGGTVKAFLLESISFNNCFLSGLIIFICILFLLNFFGNAVLDQARTILNVFLFSFTIKTRRPDIDKYRNFFGTLVFQWKGNNTSFPRKSFSSLCKMWHFKLHCQLGWLLGQSTWNWLEWLLTSNDFW